MKSFSLWEKVAEGRMRGGATLDAPSPNSPYNCKRRIEQKIAKSAKEKKRTKRKNERKLTASLAKRVDCHAFVLFAIFCSNQSVAAAGAVIP
jgi:hypothetical protein